MANRAEPISFSNSGWHKGFYNDEDFTDSLLDIKYTEFFEKPNDVDDDDFLFNTADDLLHGSCHHFAWAAHRILGYRPYIIKESEGIWNKRGQAPLQNDSRAA